MAEDIAQSPSPGEDDFGNALAKLVQSLVEGGASDEEVKGVVQEVAQQVPEQSTRPYRPLEVDIWPRRTPSSHPQVGAGDFGMPSGFDMPPMPIPARNGLAGEEDPLDIVQRVGREDRLRSAGFGSDRPGFAETATSLAPLGMGPPMPYSQTMPLPGFPNKPSGGGLSFASPAQAASPDEITARQQTLKDAGYPIDVDGKWGTESKKAWDRYQADAPRRQQQQLETDRIRAQQSGNEAELAKANAAIEAARTEAARVQAEREAAKRAADEREAGNTRTREMEENLPWYSRVFRDYAQPVAMAAGLAAGALARGRMVSGYNAGRSETATAANNLMAGAPPPGTPVNAGNVGHRAGLVNDFYTTGRGAQPFLNDATAPRGMTSNPAAPQSSSLYQPNRLANIGKDAALPAAGVVDMGVAHWQETNAQARLDAATKAADLHPTEVNLQAVQKAKEDVAMWAGVGTAGRWFAGTTGGAALLGGRSNARPGTAIPDAERAAIDAYLAQRGAGPNPAGGRPPGANGAGRPIRGAPGYTMTPYGVRGPNGRWSNEP